MENSDHKTDRSNEMSVFSSGFNVNKSWSPGTFGRPVPTDNNQNFSQGQRWQPQQQNATYGQDTYKRDHWQSQSQQHQSQSQSQYGNQRYDQRDQQQQQYNNGRSQHQSYEKQSYGQQYGQDKQYGSPQGKPYDQSNQYGQQDQRQQHHQSSYNQRGGGGQQQWGDRSYGNRPQQYRQHGGGGGYQRDRGNGYQQHRNYDQRQQRRPYQDYRKSSDYQNRGYGNQNSPWKQHSKSGMSMGDKKDWEYDSRYYDDGPKKSLEELTTLQNTSMYGNLTHEQQSEIRRMQPSHHGHGRNLRKSYLENVERRRPNQPKGALDMRLFLKFGTLDICQTQEATADDLVHCCSKNILERQVKDNVEVMHKRKQMQGGWQPNMPEMNPQNMNGVEQKLLALIMKHCDAEGYNMSSVATPMTDVVKQRHAQKDAGQLWTEIQAEIGQETVDVAMRPMLDKQSPYKM